MSYCLSGWQTFIGILAEGSICFAISLPAVCRWLSCLRQSRARFGLYRARWKILPYLWQLWWEFAALPAGAAPFRTFFCKAGFCAVCARGKSGADRQTCCKRKRIKQSKNPNINAKGVPVRYAFCCSECFVAARIAHRFNRINQTKNLPIYLSYLRFAS